MWVNDQLHALAALFLGKAPPVATEMEAECTPEPVWMFLVERNLLPLQGNEPVCSLVTIQTTLSQLPLQVAE